MSTTVLQLVSAEEVTELPMPSILYGIIALSLFALGLLVLWFFRNTAHKVTGPIDHHGEDQPGTHADIGYDTHTQRRSH